MMIRNPECCVSPPTTVCKQSWGESSECVEGAPQIPGGTTPLHLDRCSAYTRHSPALQELIPRGKHRELCNSHSKILSKVTRPSHHPSAAGNPSTPLGTGASKRPADGKEGSERNSPKQIKPFQSLFKC